MSSNAGSCGGGSCGSSSSSASSTGTSSCSSGAALKNVASQPEGEFVPSDEMPVLFTPSAIDAVAKALKDEGEDGDFLRISVVGGGCSGYQYGLDFDKEERMGDLALELNGVKVVVDAVSVGYLRGTVVDYVSGLNGTGFQFKNPNAKRTCGCGSSFS
ncbi:MAG: iron-sulfur cluster insertion protein ErpA [Proteobacteria bacterium]|nr:iron-sulfur cluster insertion protein ErpA [Pseudomonadota bacterium]